MSTKEKIKKEIDSLPDDFLNKVYEYIYSIKATKKKRISVKVFHLKGKFDNKNTRQAAYE